MQREKSLVVNNHFQLQFEKKQNCYVLLYPEGMVQLSFSAGEIMNLCNGENSCNDIIKILTDKFNNSEIENDVVDFVEDAINRTWIVYNQ